MSYRNHFKDQTATQLTDHERTVLMMNLDPKDPDQRKLGQKLAYNAEWRQVFAGKESTTTGVSK